MRTNQFILSVLRHLHAVPLFFAAVSVSVSFSSAYGQTSMPSMPGMNHGSMSEMDHEAMPGMDGAGTKKKTSPAKKLMHPTTHDHHADTMPPHEPVGPAVEVRETTTSQGVVETRDATGAAQSMPMMTRQSIYERNPDGSYAIPGIGMAMGDNDIFYQVLFDKLEYTHTRNDHGAAWDMQSWVGRDLDKFWLKSEGERASGTTNGRFEGLWSHAVAAFWDAQLGVRHDFGQSPSRQWLAFGVQGIAPYWFDVEATGYVGPSGRTAARFKADRSFRLTQVVFLMPEFDVDAYGKSDTARGIGSGLSNARFGLRLHYEIRREFAPYIGITWQRKLGETADLARQSGAQVGERQWVAGVRAWF